MGEGQRPETEVRCCVRDAVETEFCDVLAVDTISDEFLVHTNGVDDLMNHNFTELELLMLFITKVLSNHSNAFAVTVHASSSVQGIAVIIISIQSTDTGCLSKTSISFPTSLVMLMAEIKWLEEEQDRDLDNSDEHQEQLY